MTVLLAPNFSCLGRLVHSHFVSARSEYDSEFCNAISKITDRFRKGDWGDIPEEDKQLNIDTITAEKSGNPGMTLMGSYMTDCPNPVKIYIMTSGYGNQHYGADYCYTTVLFPEEY